MSYYVVSINTFERNNEMVAISRRALNAYLHNENWLWHLDCAGIDNTGAYDTALDLRREEVEEAGFDPDDYPEHDLTGGYPAIAVAGDPTSDPKQEQPINDN